MKQATRKQSAFERDYRKAWLKLLTVATQAPRQVDEYFFGPLDERDEYEESVRPYFYGCTSFIIAVTLFIFITVQGG